jgi:hypothetical protein
VTLINVPNSPDVITEEELVAALTLMNLVDNLVTIDDLSELHFTPGQLEIVYVKQIQRDSRDLRPLLVHRFVQITPRKRVQDS